MKEILKVLLFSIATFVVVSLFAICASAQGSYDMDPDYYFENGKHSENFISFSDFKLRGTDLGLFCNYHFPGEDHIGHDHTYVINGHDIIFYCFIRDLDNKLRLITRNYGFFDDSFKYLIIEGKVYIKVEEKTSFPGCPIPTGKK